MASSTNQKDIILQAATACIVKNGYANVSMRKIASEADVALSQLHYHYKSKSSLMSEVVKNYVDKYISIIKEETSKGMTPEESIELLLNTITNILEKDTEFLRLFFDLLSLSIWDEKVKEYLRELLDEIGAIFLENIPGDEGIEARKRREAISNMIIGGLLGSCIGSITLSKEDNIEYIKDSMDEMRLYIEYAFSRL